MTETPYSEVVTELNRVRAELIKVIAERDRLYQKISHGCTDATCPICDGEEDA